MIYRQLTDEERYTIAALRREGLNNPAIAERLERHRSTIWREVRRNQRNDRYRAFRAIELTSGRRKRSRRNKQFTPGQWRQLVHFLREGWSPEQISGRLRREGKLSISYETIYQYIWRDKRLGGELHQLLRQRLKKNRKRYGTHESRGRLPGKRHISERPQEVETRQKAGHWEIDTVVGVGSKDCVVTLVERKTGYAKVGKLRDRSAEEMTRCTRMLMRRSRHPFRTITSDNGTEFHNYEDVERATGTKYYFATPYHSWERGTSENFNGLVRQYLPKRTTFAHIDQNFCNYLADRLNRRPRKRLGYRTPEECFYDK